MLARAATRLATAVDRPEVAYAIAFLCVAAAAAARMALGQVIDAPIYFTTFLPAILVVALICGWLPAVLSLLVSTLLVWWVWLGEPYSFALTPGDDVRILSFVIAMGLQILFCEAVRVAVRRGFLAEQRFRVAQDHSLDAFIIAQPLRKQGQVVDFRWTYSNPAADKLAPKGVKTLAGRRVLDVFPDDTGQQMVDRMITLLSRETPDEVQVARIIDGKPFWIRSTGVRLGADVAVSFRDVTEVVEARRDLEARVIERTAELQRAMDERARVEAALAQAQKLETVGRLTGGVAHDFNNLLTVVIGGLDVILKGVDPARSKRMAEAALEAAKRGERLTRQLLAFSRRQELKLDSVDLAALIAQMEPLIRRAASEAVSLSIEADPAVGWCRVDGAQFEAALLNLVVNAADATKPGDAINVTAANVRLTHGDMPEVSPGDYVRVSVADTGEGMAPEVLARVFEPFFTTKEVGKGTGLGLAQVYGFARQIGGAVRVESALGKGTRVDIYLPCTEAAPPVETEAQLNHNPEALRGARVLLVEDDEAVLAVTLGILSDLGGDVVAEPNSDRAKARLEAGESFDLLFSDIVMPGAMSGVDLAGYAAKLSVPPAILLTTGYAGDRIAGAPDEIPWPVLRKPFRADELAAAASAALATRQ